MISENDNLHSLKMNPMKLFAEVFDLNYNDNGRYGFLPSL